MKKVKIQDHIFERIIEKMDVRQNVENTMKDAADKLYKLDLLLSNSYIGDKGERDKAINLIRKLIEKASDPLRSDRWLKHLKNLKGR